jgi:hypothetical protein
LFLTFSPLCFHCPGPFRFHKGPKMTANDLPIITDLNIAPNGDGFFDSSSQHTPAPVDGNGVVITRRSDDTAWQMLVADTSPREFWQRTWHSDQSRWRTWKRFGDMHTINQTLAAALDNLEHNIDESRIDTRIAAQIDEHIENERAARDSAIDAATTAILTARQGLIDAAITVERVRAAQTVDAKIDIVTQRLGTIEDRLTAETTARAAALSAETQARDAAIMNETDMRTSAVHEQREFITTITNAAERRINSTIVTTVEGERDRTAAAIGAAFAHAQTAITNNIAAAVQAESAAREAAITAAREAASAQQARDLRNSESALVRRLDAQDAAIRAAHDNLPLHHHRATRWRNGRTTYYSTEMRRGADSVRSSYTESTCVPAGTPVLMADGTWQAIETVQIGQMIQGRTRVNQVLAYDRMRLGDHRNPALYSINGDYINTDDHLTLLDRGWAVLDHDAYLAYHGQALNCVYLADLTQAQMVFEGIDPARVSTYGVGDNIAFGAAGYRRIDTIEQIDSDPDQIVYSLVADGDGTMQVGGADDAGYVLSAWVNETKWESASPNSGHQPAS